MFLAVAFPNFSKQPLTYVYEGPSILGHRVQVPFGSQSKVGIVISESETSDLDLEIKPIESTLDTSPILDPHHLLWLEKLSQYYQINHLDLILSTFPKDILNPECSTDPLWFSDETISKPWHQWLLEHRSNSLLKKISEGHLIPSDPKPLTPPTDEKLSQLTPEQAHVLEDLKGIHILWGQTGSGKTEVYIHWIHQILQKKQQVLLLVPEISLTEQMVHKIESRLGLKPVLIHSLLSSKTKLCRWLSIRHGDAGIIVGTRSALLYPILNLGGIIIDEEHDNAYRQEQGLFFSARDAAILKASSLNIPILLGSATPSLESYYNAHIGRYHLHVLENRYGSTPPKIHLIERPKHTFLADQLIEIIQKALDQNEHVMLYIGKRGYSRLLKCHHCGFELRCPGCDRLLVFHQDQMAKCHPCDTQIKAILDCPECQQAELSHYGAGSQRIYELSETLWPNHPRLRIDTDILTSEAASKALSQLKDQKGTVIIGTQMLTKGHDLERLNTVVVIDADHSLYAPDFRAEEKLFAELLQVSGRSGRRDVQGHVYIQTQCPSHVIFQNLNNPKAFYRYLLDKRKSFDLPPYTYIACLFIRGKPQHLNILSDWRIPDFPGVSIMGPCLFPPGQKKGQPCYQIMISSSKRPLRNQAFSTIRHYLKKHLSQKVQLLSQMDSHLSL